MTTTRKKAGTPEGAPASGTPNAESIAPSHAKVDGKTRAQVGKEAAGDGSFAKIDPQWNLARKIAVIAERIGDREAMKPDGAGVSFKYHAAKAVYGWWRYHLADAGIALIPRVLASKTEKVILPKSGGGERVTFITELEVEFALIDGHTDQRITGSSFALGEDPTDKGAGKAMTYAQKMFLLGIGMNGAESDNEEFSRPDDGTISERPRPEINSDTRVEGVQRGGRQANATNAQVQKVRVLARDIGMDVNGIINVVKNVLGDTVVVPEGKDAGPVVVKYLESLSSDALGSLIQRLEEAKERAREGAHQPPDPTSSVEQSTSPPSTPTSSSDTGPADSPSETSTTTTSPTDPSTTTSPTEPEHVMSEEEAAFLAAEAARIFSGEPPPDGG